MVDLLGTKPSEIRQCFRSNAENMLALLTILNEKGLVTQEEWDSAHARAVSSLDQHLAEERQKAYESMGDDEKKVADFMNRILGG
jgi:hypothetical protein